MGARNIIVGRERFRSASRLVFVVALLTPVTGTWAQVAAQNPPTREELNRAEQIAPADRRPSRLSVEGDIERAPCPLADARYANITTRFSTVSFEGLREVPAEALAESWSEFANRDVPLSSLCEIRDRAATILRARGYLAAVQVPPQRIEKDGIVRFDVLMAKLVGIEVRGDAGRSERLIAAHMEALKGQPVFNSHEAERHLLLARDLPGYDVRLALRPAGTAPGEVIGEVRVTRQPVRFDINVQNLGSRSVGRFGGLARLQLNDLTGMGDSTVISLFNTAQTREQTVLQVGHSMALGKDGLRLSGDFTYAWTKPDIGGGADITSDTLIASAQLSYPLLRTQARNLSVSGGFDIVDQQVDFTGVTLSDDRLRVIFARLDGALSDAESLASTNGYSAYEPRWRVGGSVELRKGLSGLGASGSKADPDAFVIRASASAEFRPVPDVTLAFAPRAQYSADPLLSFEEMSAGNYTVGRGYDPGVIAGDSGLGFAAEARLGSLMPHAVRDVALQPFVFFDAAWMWNEDAALAGTNPLKVYSAGGGVRGAWGNRARFDLTLAAPLRTPDFAARKGDVRMLFSVTTQLWPWSR
tara:strand:- start:51252 stop:53009 length:1758 start_codon:yes stop_codon:yes gene_type:complete